MGDTIHSTKSSPRSYVKNVRLDVPNGGEPSLSIETISASLSTSPLLRQALLLEGLSPSKSNINLRQSFYRATTPKSSANSPMLLSSSSYRSPIKGLKKKQSTLRCESMEDNSNASRPSRAGSIIRTKSFTYGYSWAGSDSDLSQISSTNANSFPFMNTMQQSLGVMLSASPLVMLITSLRTSTRDSFDGTSKTSAINITASVENINFSMNYKQFNKTAAEVGDLHLDLLLKACLEQVQAILADLQTYDQEASNQVTGSTIGAVSADENQQRLQPQFLNDSIIRASLDEAHPSNIQNYQVEFAHDHDHDESDLFENRKDLSSHFEESHHRNEGENKNFDDSLLNIRKVGSNDSNFSLNDQRMIPDSSSESTVNNNLTSRHSSRAIMNITPSISNCASEDLFDNDTRSLQVQHDFITHPDPEESMILHESIPPDDHSHHRIEQSKSAESGMQPSNLSMRSRTRSLTIKHNFFHINGLFGSNDPLVSEIDIGIHEYSTILYRLIDLACTHSEILQLQNKDEEAIDFLIRTFYYTNIFVNKYLSDWETLLLFASLDDDVNQLLNIEFNESIMKNMDNVFQQLCVEKKIHWFEDSFVNSFVYPSPLSSPGSPPLTTSNINTHNSFHGLNGNQQKFNSPTDLPPPFPNDPISSSSSTPVKGATSSLQPPAPPSPPQFLRDKSQDINLILNLENLCKVLSKYDHSHTLYAIAHGIRRLGVVLKNTRRLSSAYTAVQTCVHIFELLETIYHNQTIDLSSCYALLASILEEMNSPQESIAMDRKGLELSSVGKI